MLCITISPGVHKTGSNGAAYFMPRPAREPYIVQSVVHAAEILGAFQSAGEALRLRDVVERTGFGKGMCFRLLHTLHHCGLLDKVDATRFREAPEKQFGPGLERP